VAAIVVTLVVGIFGPTANGDRFALFQIVDATVASTIIVMLLIALTYNRLPWRPLPAEGRDVPAVLDTLPVPVTSATQRPTAAPDAYADST
jgi:alpha-1,6-mannosyltransferase